MSRPCASEPKPALAKKFGVENPTYRRLRKSSRFQKACQLKMRLASEAAIVIRAKPLVDKRFGHSKPILIVFE
jgi:hypothetical protein